MNPKLEKHHRRSIRLPEYDYSSNGAYFVTICTRNRECILSETNQPVGAGLAPAHDPASAYDLRLTAAGIIVQRNWEDIPARHIGVEIDEYVIMPSHLHGIIVIATDSECPNDDRATARVAPTLGDIIGSFKSACVTDYLKYIDENRLDTVGKIWQRNYHEHIIRTDEDLQKIREYIRNNPRNWADDEENPTNTPIKTANKQLHGTKDKNRT